ncbi:MAG TPA: 1,4-alpha-glucan branching enzyme, partial [Lachnospiraceae bacterium]|nr:1,4-alpha-glucan branching enzyme [Lachnospiraceae bacterium]
QDEEWNEATELNWGLLADELHSGMKLYVSKLLEIYNKYPALHEIDNSWDGFEWINADDSNNSTYTYFRKPSDGKNRILVVLNMTPMEREGYKVGVPEKKKYTLLLNSDDKQFGGNGKVIPKTLTAKEEEASGKPYSIKFDLPAYGAAIFRF